MCLIDEIRCVVAFFVIVFVPDCSFFGTHEIADDLINVGACKLLAIMLQAMVCEINCDRIHAAN